VTYLCLIVIEIYVFISTLFSVCRTWIDDSFTGTGHYRQVNMVLGNLVRLHWPDLVILPSGESVPATTWEHYRYGVCRTFGNCRRFDPGGSLDRRVNCCCVSQPRWVGARRNTRGKTVRGNRGLVLSCAQGGCACSRGLQAFARERESVGPFSRAATFSYESPGPSFYRCKERAHVYNGGCSNVLTCLAEGSQSPMYMPSWLSERFWRPVHVMSWLSEERLSPVEVQLSRLSDPC
jgi:hypothetical protein